jgi:hypothetical protein
MADAMLDARQDGGSYRRIEVITGPNPAAGWTSAPGVTAFTPP